MAFGLFAPDDMLDMYGSGNTMDQRLGEYFEKTWQDGQPTAPGFNAARYRKQVPGFDPAQDDPISHALLEGMKGAYARRRLLDKLQEPVGKSDITAARAWLRRESFQPGRFKGRIILILSERIYARGGMRGWERHVDGMIEVRKGRGNHQSYLKEHLLDTAQVIRKSIEKIWKADKADMVCDRYA